MADNLNPTAAEGSPVGAPTGGVGPDAGMVPQDKVNRLESKWRRVAEEAAAKAADLEKQLVARADAEKTEQQKALESARKDAAESVRKEYEVKMLSQQIDSELRLQLLNQGLDPDLAHLVKAKAEIKSVDDIADAITAAFDGKDWLKKQVRDMPSQSGAPTGPLPSGRWTEAKLQEAMSRGGVGGLTEADWNEIKAAYKSGTWQ